MKIKSMQSPMKCDEAIKCVFNLNKLDLRVYKKLKEIGPIRANELAKHLNRERSTVYRSLQKLSKVGMCRKITKTLDRGGYYHVYRCDSIENIKKQAQKCLDSWYTNVKKTLEALNE
ncbi:MAG: HTH domain-containing protein [Candidatus Thermoplasmatota archaeon]|nr:HTH domain-containing protein [Candidatus Thermoplasmatota archaeon]